MSSPYTSNLLQQRVDTTAPHPTAPQHVRSVTQVVPAPAPVQHYAPQPQVVYAAPAGGGGSAVTSILLGVLVVLLGAVALIGAYYATQQSSPSEAEAALERRIAMGEGFRNGRERGVDAGRGEALSYSSTTGALRVAAAREQAYAAAFRRGQRAGQRSYQRPTYTGGYGRSSYRAPRYGGIGNIEVAQAFGQAQNLANLTGAPVDVEIY